jgi:hypothetical protein
MVFTDLRFWGEMPIGEESFGNAGVTGYHFPSGTLYVKRDDLRAAQLSMKGRRKPREFVLPAFDRPDEAPSSTTLRVREKPI